ncbi:hypothetical protein PWT90_07893 [Aphanocladium album]|nr:hypothetical protein PWT90_07893 [Aphanocladium album]
MADFKKKLPFKPTALRNARPKPTPTSSTEDELLQASARDHHGDDSGNDKDQDTLALFRRAKEMAPIVEADRERRMRRQLQKQREQEEAEERRRVSAGSKHPLGEGEEGATTTPTATQAEDTIMATQEEDNRELVTPPPSKRSRRNASGSSAKHKDVDLEAAATTSPTPDSPTLRAMRSLGPDRSMTPALYTTSLYSSGAVSTTSTYNTRAQARQGRAPPPPAGSQIISLDSDSEPEITMAPAPPAEIIDQALTLDLDLNADAPEDDDEFAEYVRRAQEQRDKHLLQREQEAAEGFGAAPAPSSLTPAAPDLAASASSSPALDKAGKQIIDIVITSEVPSSRMCLIKFHFDRPLRVVRDSWTALQHRHNVPLRVDRGDDDVILTWRRKKVYMVSTLLSLGIRPSDAGDGSVIVEGYRNTSSSSSSSGGGGGGGGGSREGFNESRTRVHMQAWTPALFAEMERAEEDERRRREAEETSGGGGTQDTAADDEDGEAAAEDAAATVTKLRVILKSKDLEPVRLKVMPETTTETLVAAFCAQRGVGEDRDVGLWFDGMRLEQGATMADADIDDMDTIEVHVK